MTVANPAAGNPYPWGQCTWWAWGESSAWLPVLYGDARWWITLAQRKGLPTSMEPRVGAVAVWGANMGGAGGFGHVAVVTAINITGGGFAVSEMNFTDGLGRVDVRPVRSMAGILGFIDPPAAPPAPPAPAPFGGTTWVAFTGTVQVAAANVRSGPTTLDGILRRVTAGQVLGFDGWCYGPAEWDPVARQSDRRWFHIDAAHGYGWIASAEVNGNPPNSHP